MVYLKVAFQGSFLRLEHFLSHIIAEIGFYFQFGTIRWFRL